MRSPVERLKHRRPYQPTIEVEWTAIDRVRVENLFNRFRAISVPLAFQNQSIGLDGTSYELALGNYMYHSRIHWWSQLPPPWRALQPVVTELLELFEHTWTTVTDSGEQPDTDESGDDVVFK